MWPYYLLVFVGSAGVMTIELVAGRLIAPSLGVSLYTWTSILGIVLAGMSGGYAAGGWLADRLRPRLLLGTALLLSGLTTAGIIPLLPLVLEELPYKQLSPVIGVVLPVLLLFFVPAFCLAMISPAVYKLSLKDLQQTGAVVGRLAACNALGGIAGTFATGFWLIPAFGTRTIVLVVGLILVILGLIFLPWRRRAKAAAGLIIILFATGGILRWPHILEAPCQVESAYFCIKVEWKSSFNSNKRSKLLLLDNLIHSAVNPEDPNDLWYGYEKIKAWILTSLNRPSPRAFFIGGGGYTLPSWMERNLEGAMVEVAEIDPAVTRVALNEFISAPTQIHTYSGDARRVLQAVPPGPHYDVIVGDAFNDISVPYHLTTLEFAQVIKERLAPGGLYIANIIDFSDGLFQGSFGRTLAQLFPHVYLISDRNHFSPTPTTIVVVASLSPLPWNEWQQQSDLQVSVEERGPGGHMKLLTDDHAPVDSMLLPVFANRW